MSKYVITWPNNRVGRLYFRTVRYTYFSSADAEGKTLDRTANLSEAQIYNSFDDATAEFSRHIEPDSSAEIIPVTEKELFHAKLVDDPVTSKKRNGIST